MKDKIIVTGGAGFIGSHLVKKLVNDGESVIVIDNLITTGTPRYLKELMDEKIVFIQADIRNLGQILGGVQRSLEKGERIKEIYNLASPASVKLYTSFPELTYQTSTIGVQNMIEVAKCFGFPEMNFLETSTSEVYGDPLVHPQVESYLGNVSTQCERSCYDEGKRGAEVLCYLAHKHGLRTHIARLFNVYGPNNTDDRVMPTFIMQASQNKPITVFGDGKQTRSFCYVEDIVEGLIALQRSDVFTPVNLGNPDEITINELAEKVKIVMKSDSQIEYHPLPEMDPTRRCPDITKAYNELKWMPRVPLLEGIALTCDWILKNQEHAD